MGSVEAWTAVQGRTAHHQRLDYQAQRGCNCPLSPCSRGTPAPTMPVAQKRELTIRGLLWQSKNGWGKKKGNQSVHWTFSPRIPARLPGWWRSEWPRAHFLRLVIVGEFDEFQNDVDIPRVVWRIFLGEDGHFQNLIEGESMNIVWIHSLKKKKKHDKSWTTDTEDNESQVVTVRTLYQGMNLGNNFQKKKYYFNPFKHPRVIQIGLKLKPRCSWRFMSQTSFNY